MHFVIYTKEEKEPKRVNIYAKSQTLFKNQDNLRYVFIHKKPDNLYYAIFINILKFSFLYIQKSWQFALHEVLYTKRPTLRKPRQFELRFIYSMILTLCITRFSLDFWNCFRAGDIFLYQNNSLCINFLYKKNNALSRRYIYIKSDTLRHIFICKKTMHFALRFYIQKSRYFALHVYIKNDALCGTFVYI